MSIDDTIAERRATHGDFVDVARDAQRLKAIMREANYGGHGDEVRESLELIATKLARVIHGANPVDSLHDLGGYARLAELAAIRAQQKT